MHALRRIHRALVPRGMLLDLHPVPPTPIELHGAELGEVDEREFIPILRATEGELERTVRDGLFVHEREVRLEVLEHFESGDELLQHAEGWENIRLPPEVAQRARGASEPLVIRHRLVLRRLRAV